MTTEEQIQERAKEIGLRNYYPIPSDLALVHPLSHRGITIRQELMRTAMGAMIGMDSVSYLSIDDRVNSKVNLCTYYTNALLIQMAKDELGICEQ